MGGTKSRPVYFFVYLVDRCAGVIMSEKVFELRDFLSIFVHGKLDYIDV